MFGGCLAQLTCTSAGSRWGRSARQRGACTSARRSGWNEPFSFALVTVRELERHEPLARNIVALGFHRRAAGLVCLAPAHHWRMCAASRRPIETMRSSAEGRSLRRGAVEIILSSFLGEVFCAFFARHNCRNAICGAQFVANGNRTLKPICRLRERLQLARAGIFAITIESQGTLACACRFDARGEHVAERAHSSPHPVRFRRLVGRRLKPSRRDSEVRLGNSFNGVQRQPRAAIAVGQAQ